MKFKLAILNVLATSPGRHLTLDEVRRAAELLVASEGQTEQLKRFSALGDIDIFQSGLVLQDDAGFQITDAGRALLHSLESASEPSVELFSTTSPGLPFIDHLIDNEERQRIFDLGLRRADRHFEERADFDPDQSGHEVEDGSEVTGTPVVTSEAGSVDPRESTDASILDGTAEGNGLQPSRVKESQAIAIEPPEPAPHGANEFLRRSFGSKVQEPNRSSRRRSGIFGYVATKMRLLSAPWRGHFAQSVPNPKTELPVGRVGGAAFALLSLVAVAACAGAVVAFVQIKALKSEIAMLHREVLPLKEGLARLEQAEKTKVDLDQQEGGQKKSSGEIRTEQTALNLSREEIQLIREYIKPAPSAGTAAPAINVGDPVGGATIPLPSPVTEKIPKLLGAKFTTRNGAIIIIKRDSRQADAVLPLQ